MELKSNKANKEMNAKNSFNRTFMELKSYITFYWWF